MHHFVRLAILPALIGAALTSGGCATVDSVRAAQAAAADARAVADTAIARADSALGAAQTAGQTAQAAANLANQANGVAVQAQQTAAAAQSAAQTAAANAAQANDQVRAAALRAAHRPGSTASCLSPATVVMRAGRRSGSR